MSKSTIARRKMQRFSNIKFPKQELLTLLSSTKPLSEIKTYLNKKYYKPHEPKITLTYLENYIRIHNISRPITIKNVYNDKDFPRLAYKQRISLYNQGLNDREISEKLNLDEPTINIWRKEYNLPSITQLKTQKRKELHKQGKTDKEIATILKTSGNIIASWRAKYNISSNKFKNKTQIHNLYKQGLTDEEIASKINRHPSTVTLWRNKNKLQSNFKKQFQKDVETVKNLHKKGIIPSKISNNTGIDIEKIYRIIHKIKRQKH